MSFLKLLPLVAWGVSIPAFALSSAERDWLRTDETTPQYTRARDGRERGAVEREIVRFHRRLCFTLEGLAISVTSREAKHLRDVLDKGFRELEARGQPLRASGSGAEFDAYRAQVRAVLSLIDAREIPRALRKMRSKDFLQRFEDAKKSSRSFQIEAQRSPLPLIREAKVKFSEPDLREAPFPSRSNDADAVILGGGGICLLIARRRRLPSLQDAPDAGHDLSRIRERYLEISRERVRG